MRKPVQKNHNKANSKEIHAPHPTNKKAPISSLKTG